jgi:lysozyme
MTGGRRASLFAATLLAATGCVGRAGAGDVGNVGVVDEAASVCAAGDVVKGIDVSHYDGTIDWAKVKASGIDFAFMKATQGTTFVDPDFATNWKDAGAAGVIRGAYHYLQPELDATAQADFFIATAGMPATGDLPMALDLEVLDNLTGAQVAAAAQTFLARVQAKTGRVPVVYTSARFWGTLGTPGPSPTPFQPYALWDAQWTTACPNMPAPWMTWTFWQYASTGTVPGISGMANVDLDEYNGSLASLQGYVSAGADGGVDGGTDDGGVSDDAGPTTGSKHGGCAMGGAGGGAEAPAWLAMVLVATAALRTRRRARPSAR